MKIADEDAVLIENLYLSKGWGARKLLSEFPDKGWKLGSIDYKICGIMQQRVYESRINSVDELKQRLHDVWHSVQQHIIDLAVSQWRQRACVHTRDIWNICCELV